MNSRFMAVACLTVTISVSGVLAARALAPEKFGAGVTISQVTPLDAVIKTPETFDGRTVRVERDDRVAVQVRALPIAAEGAGNRRRERDVHDAA